MAQDWGAREVYPGNEVQSDEQLAHGAHDEEEHEADDHVDEDDRRAGDRNGLAGAHEQAHADRAANGDQLEVSIGEPALESGSELVVLMLVAFQECGVTPRS
ncbi:hypothetical protein JOE62_003155 [Glutamicibacter nicotianae]|nr:hypothetical protein [Glutamicibacter nicotianae]